MAYSVGNLSECHLNPAVSLAFLIRKKMSIIEFVCYIAGQILGALVGSVLLGICLRGYWGVLYSSVVTDNLRHPYKKDKNGWNRQDGWYYVDGLLVEALLTFIFVFAFQGVKDTKYHDGKHAGIVIGLSYVLVTNM